MPLKLVPVVEGFGEVEAVPLLLRRLLREQFGYDERDFEIARPKNAKGCGGLISDNGIERYVKHAFKEDGCAGVIVLIDNDPAEGLAHRNKIDDTCAPALAQYLACRVQAIHPFRPVAIIVARWEYEAWFLASLETAGPAVGMPADTVYRGDVESERSANGWIEKRLPPDRKYFETHDQAAMTQQLDLERVTRRSRSFRRLRHALEQLIDAYLQGQVVVTPFGEEP